jgi:hypothetical protein
MWGAIISFVLWVVEKFLGGSKPSPVAQAAAENVELKIEADTNAKTLQANQNVIDLASRTANADSLRRYETADPNNRDN